MFKRSRTPEFENIDTVIANQVLIKGRLAAEGSARIDGCVEGEVDIKGDVVLGEKGYIQGNINASNLLIGGKIEGNVITSGRTEILATGEVVGDIAADILVIEEGAIFRGTSKMVREKQTKRNEPRSKAAAAST